MGAADRLSTRPSWKVKLIVRIEEFDTGVLKTRVPPKATKSLDGLKDDGAQLEAVPDPDKPGRFVIRRKGSSGPLGQGQGPWFDPSAAPPNATAGTSSDDGLTHEIYGIIPRRFSLKRNGIRTPDELSVSLSWFDFPFDPRAIRSIAIEFFLGCLSAEEYAQGVRGKTRGDVFGPSAAHASEPMNVIADTYVDDRGSPRTNRRFEGWVDKMKLAWSEDEPIVEMECRDNTQLLQNQIAPPKLAIGAKQPLDQAIAVYISNFPQCSGLTVEYLASPDGEAAPTLEKVLAGSSFKPALGPVAAKGGGDSDDLMVWDYITDVCGAVGLVSYLDGTAIVIARPSTVLGGVASTRKTDPYVSRNLPEGEFPVRALIYGKNVRTLEFERDFATKEAKNIEIRCFLGSTVVAAHGIERAFRRYYSGETITVRAGAEGGRVLTGTPNHPILTRRGWVAMNEIVKGDHLICCDFAKRGSFANPHVDAAPTEFVELFDSLANAWRMERRTSRNVDFHGDGREAEVEIVNADLLLRNDCEASSPQHCCQVGLEATRDSQSLLKSLRTCSRGPNDAFSGDRGSSSRGVGFCDESCSLFRRGLGVAESRSFASPSNDDSPIPEFVCKALATDPAFPTQGIECLPVGVFTSEVIEVERGTFSGHVFNLQTASGWYSASGVIAHNCFSTRRKQVLVARYPEKADRLVSVKPGDGSEDNKWDVVRVRGVEDQATLKQMAKDYYYGRMRQELELVAKTDDMFSYGGSGGDPDLLDMQATDPVEILIDRVGDGTIAGAQKAIDANRQWLAGLGYSKALSEAYSKAVAAAGFQKLYRIREINIEGDVETGIEIELRGANFIQVRAEKVK